MSTGSELDEFVFRFLSVVLPDVDAGEPGTYLSLRKKVVHDDD